MDWVMFCAVLAGIFFLAYLISCISIVNFLARRKIKINYWLIRILMIKYANQYRDITLEETGEVGPLFRLWSYSAILMLACTALAIIIKIS